MGRLRALPGFGEQKAKIFAALLGKQLGVRPDGWREATTPYGKDGSSLSVADITDPESLARVRATKKAMKAKAKARPTAADRHRGPDLSERRLYLCTLDRPGPGRLSRECIAGGVDVVQLRDKELEARPLLARAPVAAAGVPRPRRALRAERPPGPRARGGGRRRPRGPRRRAGLAGPAHPGPRRHRRPLDPRPGRPRRRRTRTSPTSRLGPWRRRPPSPAVRHRASATSLRPVHAPVSLCS